MPKKKVITTEKQYEEYTDEPSFDSVEDWLDFQNANPETLEVHLFKVLPNNRQTLVTRFNKPFNVFDPIEMMKDLGGGTFIWKSRGKLEESNRIGWTHAFYQDILEPKEKDKEKSTQLLTPISDLRQIKEIAAELNPPVDSTKAYEPIKQALEIMEKTGKKEDTGAWAVMQALITSQGTQYQAMLQSQNQQYQLMIGQLMEIARKEKPGLVDKFMDSVLPQLLEIWQERMASGEPIGDEGGWMSDILRLARNFGLDKLIMPIVGKQLESQLQTGQLAGQEQITGQTVEPGVSQKGEEMIRLTPEQIEAVNELVSALKEKDFETVDFCLDTYFSDFHSKINPKAKVSSYMPMLKMIDKRFVELQEQVEGYLRWLQEQTAIQE